MDIKYYDLLSTTIIGVTIVASINYLFLENIEIDGIVYLALGYLAGYFINVCVIAALWTMALFPNVYIKLSHVALSFLHRIHIPI